jgi:hypothetical protein
MMHCLRAIRIHLKKMTQISYKLNKGRESHIAINGRKLKHVSYVRQLLHNVSPDRAFFIEISNSDKEHYKFNFSRPLASAHLGPSAQKS